MLQVSRANNLKIPKTLENVSGNLNSLEDKAAVKQALATANDKRFNKKKVIESIEKDKELEQIIVAMDGACEFVLDDGKTQEVVRLNRPDKALYIGKNMWREMRHFSYGCKLMVLASKRYDEKEYIRNYDDFLKEVNKWYIL